MRTMLFDRWTQRSVRRGALLSLAFVAFSLLGVGLTPAFAAAPFVMGEDVDVTTTTQMNGLWRKVQAKLTPGFNFLCEEWEDLEQLKKFDVDMSTREITVPVDINEDGGVSSIDDGGWESYASSPVVEELSLAFITLNKRFTVSQLDEWVETNNQAALISSQIVYQGKKAIEAIAAQYGDYFYGYSTAVLATVKTASAAAASHTAELTNGYGQTFITDTAYITRMFKLNERVGLIRGGARIARGRVTAKDAAAGTLDITWLDGATPALVIGDQLVKANAMDNSLAGTDLNKGLVGLLEMALATSVHGLSSGDVPEWSAGFTDVSGGRFNGIRFHKGNDEVGNYGGGQLKKIWMSQGVYRDMLEFYQDSLQFTDAFSLEADGKVGIKGTEFVKTRRVPPKTVIAADPKSVRRLPSLLRKPNGQVRWKDGEKIPNRSAYVFPMNFVAQNVVLNRKNIAVWTGLTEQ